MTDPKKPAGKTAGPSQASIVRIYIEGQGYFQGILSEVGATAVLVDFPIGEAPALPVKGNIDVALSDARASSSIKLPAMVAYKGEDEYRCRYRLEIGAEARAAVEILVDARRTYRVRPDFPVAVTVTVQSDERRRQVHAALHDVSRTGMSITVDQQADEPLAGANWIEIRLRLPGGGAPLNLVGAVRHRDAQLDRVRYGIQLQAATPDNQVDHERYASFVIELQTEVLERFVLKTGVQVVR